MKKPVFVFVYFLFFFFLKTFHAQAAGILYQCKEDEVFIQQNSVWFGTDQKGFMKFQIIGLSAQNPIQNLNQLIELFYDKSQNIFRVKEKNTDKIFLPVGPMLWGKWSHPSNNWDYTIFIKFTDNMIQISKESKEKDNKGEPKETEVQINICKLVDVSK